MKWDDTNQNTTIDQITKTMNQAIKAKKREPKVFKCRMSEVKSKKGVPKSVCGAESTRPKLTVMKINVGDRTSNVWRLLSAVVHRLSLKGTGTKSGRR